MSVSPRKQTTRRTRPYQERVCVSLYLERSELEMLRDYTEQNCMSVSNFVRRLVKRYVETHQAPRARAKAEESP